MIGLKCDIERRHAVKADSSRLNVPDEIVASV